jgi:hypothetical protein
VAREAAILLSSMTTHVAMSFSARRTSGMCVVSSSGSGEFICDTDFVWKEVVGWGRF